VLANKLSAHSPGGKVNTGMAALWKEKWADLKIRKGLAEANFA